MGAMLHQVRIDRTFDAWRDAARALLQAEMPPEQVVWIDNSMHTSLFPGFVDPPACMPVVVERPVARVPREFMSLARTVAHHREASRWALLYRALWRVTHGEAHLLQLASDDDTRALLEMEKAVRRDRHKMTAFVRFRRVVDDGIERYVAFHRPEHFVVPLVESFFVDRFRTMCWTIFTPDESLDWDGERATYLAGVERSPVDADDLESLWRTYYANIFNPARIKLKAMRKEMPAKHWATMPETQIIPDLLRQAPQRVSAMIARSRAERSAADFLPTKITLPTLRKAAAGCEGCELYKVGTQTVFGEGPGDAKLMIVGEQPGDQEDHAGRPFVGPAGKVLDAALEAAGIDRASVYLTNAVKHFSYTQRGERRIHAKPTARQIAACRPWVENEIRQVRPTVLLCMGATAAQSLIGPSFRITRSRGEVMQTQWCDRTLASWHPSAILRVPDDAAREQMRSQMIDDLRTARKLLNA